MPRHGRASAPKGKAPTMDWQATDDPDCVAEDGWEDEEERLWNCTMCKRYVKMKHLLKLWPRSQAIISGPRREGPTSNCQSEHFMQRYHEVTIAVGVRNSRPEIMLYSNMAMVWAEIVLHKDVDWSTVAGLNVSNLNRSQHFILTEWTGPSDCWPRWSNRGARGNLNAQPEQDAPPRGYGGHTQDQYNDSGPAPLSFGIGSGGYYHGNNQLGTGTTTPDSHRGAHPRDMYESRGEYGRGPNALNTYMPTNPRDTYDVRGQYGRGTSSPEYHRPTYPRDKNESGGQYGRRSNVEGSYVPTYPTDTYDHHGQYGRAINSPEYRTPSHPKDTYESGGQYGRRSHAPDSYTPTYARDTYDQYGQHGRTFCSPDYRTPTQPSERYEPYRNFPSKEREQHTVDYTNYGYGGNASGSKSTPPPPFRSREDEEAEYERQMREATILSQQEYIRKLEEDKNFMERRLYDVYSGGQYSDQAGPSRRHDDSDSDED